MAASGAQPRTRRTWAFRRLQPSPGRRQAPRRVQLPVAQRERQHARTFGLSEKDGSVRSLGAARARGVEGSSDQHYLTALKTLLVASGQLKPVREFIFPPAGGTKNTRMVASILTGRDEALPYMILDGDAMGRKLVKELGSSLYQDNADRLISVDDHTGMEGSEIEDLIPPGVMAAVIDRMYRSAGTEFGDVLQAGKPMVSQTEGWAATQNQVDLEPGWQVELSKRVKQQLLGKGMAVVKQESRERWQRLFDILGSSAS